MTTLKYLHSDAWILLACIYASRDGAAKLTDVVAAADYIQHAIVTFEEMQGALTRLIAGGYLKETNMTLLVSENTINHYHKISSVRRRVLEEERDMVDYLNAEPWRPGYDPRQSNRDAGYPALKRTLFDKAVQLYLQRLGKSS